MDYLKHRWEIILFSLCCIVLALTTNLPVFADWERRILLHALLPENLWIKTIIHPRGNIGGFEYWPLDIARYVIQIFGISFLSIRIVPVIWGLLALLTFYKISRLWCSERSSLIVTGLLASNSVFLVFQHQLLIPIAEIFFVLLVVYTYLLAKNNNIVFVRLFAFALGLAILHYIIGRLVCLGFMFIWLIALYLSKEIKWKGKIKILYNFVGFFLLTLLFQNPINLFRFFSIKLLIPESGGSINNEMALTANDFIQNFSVNLPLVLDSFFGFDKFYGDSPLEIYWGVPATIITTPVLILFVAGIIIAIKQRYIWIYMLLVITLVLPAASQVYLFTQTSLSPHRQVYSLIPIFICIALLYSHKFKNREYMTKILQIAGSIIIFWQIFSYFHHKEHLNSLLSNSECSFKNYPKLKAKKFLCSVNVPRYNDAKVVQQKHFKKWGTHFTMYQQGYHALETQLMPLHRYAALLTEKINKLKSDKPILLVAPVTDFVASHSQDWNSIPLLLGAYLNTNGVPVNIIIPYPRQQSKREIWLSFIIDRLWTTQYKSSYRLSQHLNYPYQIDTRSGQYNLNFNTSWHHFGKGLKLHNPKEVVESYIKPDALHIQVRALGGKSKVYLVTTNYERNIVEKMISDLLIIEL